MLATDCRFPDDEGRRGGDAAEGAGRGRGGSRRRGAGLPDAGAHLRGGAGRHRRQLHEVHDELRDRRSEAGGRARYRTDYGVEYSPAEIIITAGGKQALFNAVMVPVRRG